MLLWFYVSGIALLAGAELNAEIEHASPYGKAPGQKNADGKRILGARAARAHDKGPGASAAPSHSGAKAGGWKSATNTGR